MKKDKNHKKSPNSKGIYYDKKAERLQKTRGKLSRAKLAKLAENMGCSVSEQYIYYLETGRSPINCTKKLKAIANALNVSVEYLLCETDYSSKKDEIVSTMMHEQDELLNKIDTVNSFMKNLMHITKIEPRNPEICSEFILYTADNRKYYVSFEQLCFIKAQIENFATSLIQSLRAENQRPIYNDAGNSIDNLEKRSFFYTRWEYTPNMSAENFSATIDYMKNLDLDKLDDYTKRELLDKHPKNK